MRACGVHREPPPVEAFREAFASPRAWTVFDDVRETLGALNADGYRLAILSNWDSRLPRLLDRLELTPFFDVILGSALSGMEKPNRRFYELEAAELALPPSSIVHVGDLVREDYLGARNAGFHALWIDRRPEGSPGETAVEAAHVIRSIAEVRAKLNGRAPGFQTPVDRP
jgi:putative hydrolase of the HAD superfamily